MSPRPGRLLPICLALILHSTAFAGSPRPRVDRAGDPLPEGAVARLGSARLRHPAHWVSGVAISPDGRVIATVGSDASLRLWDFATGRLLRVVPNHQASDMAPAFLSDGKAIASVEGHVVRLLDADTGEERRRFEGERGWRIYSQVVSPDGKALAFDYGYRQLILCDLTTGKVLHRRHHSNDALLAFSPGRRLLTAGGSILDIRTGKETRLALWPDDDPPTAGAFSQDGRHLATVHGDDPLSRPHP